MRNKDEHRCQYCIELERQQDEKMEYYISLVDRQSRIFREGHAAEAKDLDLEIREAKAEHSAAVQRVLAHSTLIGNHYDDRKTYQPTRELGGTELLSRRPVNPARN